MLQGLMMRTIQTIISYTVKMSWHVQYLLELLHVSVSLEAHCTMTAPIASLGLLAS